MAYTITDECIQCLACIPECSSNAISEKDGLVVIDAALCTECGSCADVCPVGAPQKL
ncbi:MAG TPA: 4Fe-4S binding protein [Anaerolineaceae bacterium]|nr:4Fe-4S binding protein [Anaerolineaceae bacterium]HNZ01553.1 4Fe-4S binding protein [Anaerolineaceae bacterium]HOD44721.1 4Fe-4S binding protein [Anaerolineaceae bacterium]HOH20061.1 4Fe-4S binding protein [Anaerolineaceae bacterium]HOU44010.1 4Fe-4S binding protein [Anaerolineaceae bacterium]